MRKAHTFQWQEQDFDPLGNSKKIVKIWDYRIGGVKKKIGPSDRGVGKILPHRFQKIGTPTPPVINYIGGWDGFLPFGGWGEFWGRGEFWGVG